MTVTRSSAAIRAELSENALGYNKAREDALLFERLKAAAANTAKLAAKGEALRAELLKAEEREDSERREAKYANIRNMRVTAHHRPEDDRASPIAPQYIIRFERLAYNSSTHRNEWVADGANGFANLAPDQFGYLVEKAPEQIPAGIMALAPGDPVEAFRIYSLGMRRGYIKG